MSTTTPVWTDNVAVVASASVAFGGTVVRGTVDLRTAFGAYLHLRLGRLGTTALNLGVDVLVRRRINNTTITHPGPIWSARSQNAAAVTGAVNVTAAAGDMALVLTDVTGFAAGDIVMVGGGTARQEFLRVSKIPAALTLTFDTPIQFAHTLAQADAVFNKADAWPPLPVDGGAVIEVIFDYGANASGADVRVECLGQVHTGDTTV